MVSRSAHWHGPWIPTVFFRPSLIPLSLMKVFWSWCTDKTTTAKKWSQLLMLTMWQSLKMLPVCYFDWWVHGVREGVGKVKGAWGWLCANRCAFEEDARALIERKIWPGYRHTRFLTNILSHQHNDVQHLVEHHLHPRPKYTDDKYNTMVTNDWSPNYPLPLPSRSKIHFAGDGRGLKGTHRYS